MTALSDLVSDPAVGISRGASRCVLLDAEGRVRGWVDPITRERRNARGRLTGARLPEPEAKHKPAAIQRRPSRRPDAEMMPWGWDE